MLVKVVNNIIKVMQILFFLIIYNNLISRIEIAVCNGFKCSSNKTMLRRIKKLNNKDGGLTS